MTKGPLKVNGMKIKIHELTLHLHSKHQTSAGRKLPLQNICIWPDTIVIIVTVFFGRSLFYKLTLFSRTAESNALPLDWTWKKLSKKYQDASMKFREKSNPSFQRVKILKTNHKFDSNPWVQNDNNILKCRVWWERATSKLPRWSTNFCILLQDISWWLNVT